MRKIQSSLVYLLFFAVSHGQAQNPGLKISHLTGDFYVFTTYQTYSGSLFPSNGLYLVTEKGVVLIDTPWDTTQFQPLLDSISYLHHQDVVICIATHSHEDRTGGLEYFKQKGVKTYTTKQTDEICKIKGRKRAEYLIEQDTTFAFGEHSFQTYYPGQGHTADNIVIWFGKEKILYGGCLVKSTEAKDLGNLADANIKEYTPTIKTVQRKFRNPKFIIPGHQGWYSRQALHHTLKLIKQHQKVNRS